MCQEHKVAKISVQIFCCGYFMATLPLKGVVFGIFCHFSASPEEAFPGFFLSCNDFSTMLFFSTPLGLCQDVAMDQGPTSVALTFSSGFDGCSASGFNVCDDLIMTHGALLNERFTTTPKLYDFIENLTAGELQSVPLSLRDDLRVRVYQQQTSVSLNDCGKNSSRELKEIEGSIIVVWKCPLLENAFGELLNSWSFDKSRKNGRSLLSIFMIVQLNKNSGKKYSLEKEVSRVRRVLDRFLENIHNPVINPPRGTNVEIFSTPFGNPVFVDSLSHGVISNVFGEYGCILLTDANAVPGSEGAPIYVTRTE